MWLIIGLIIGAGLLAWVYWIRERHVKITWYEWLLGIIGLMVLLFAIENFTKFLAEHETRAAWRFLLIAGLPSLMLLSLYFLLPWRRHHKAG